MAGFSPTRLDRCRAGLADHVERGSAPGLVALVDRGGETHVPMAGGLTRDTLFRISSMTEPVTAVAAMALVEDCALRLRRPGGRPPARTCRDPGAARAGRSSRGPHRPGCRWCTTPACGPTKRSCERCPPRLRRARRGAGG
ncbi:beta-lactamase family protein [Actinokineospora sp. PR83]|uniref:serine hydrolase n=1 Tax=Actinokineospora sp. PR83 TaxID=2884908 RepID=UPI0027E1003C|nr:serine hydrolase domain-containing protein [Actinokineospora sp. PR83]MCG8919000.1 beta-lactamase family protein [Actinokineospora sp. PR83]